MITLALIQQCEGGRFCAVENCEAITYINKGGTKNENSGSGEIMTYL